MSTFGSTVFAPNGASVQTRSLGKPAGIFPGAIATDSDMTIAVDRQQTRLALPLNATDTQMTVLDPSAIVAFNLLSIDNEIVKTTGAPAGNVVPIQRAFDGTTAALHLASATVSGFIDAYHHNRLVAEVEAIENALGPNLSKVPGSLYLSIPSFNFAPQSPGGSLTVGNNVITIAPVPQGVNGSDTHHYVYISGGTGTAEAALITGGSAVEGAASGTLIVNCANTHSGAWTISSATAGASEAVQHGQALFGQGFQAYFGAGSFNFYAPVRVSGNGVHVRGMGMNATFLNVVPVNTSAFELIAPSGTGYFNELSDLSLQGSASSASGYAINCASTQSNVVIDRISIQSFYNGIFMTNAAFSVVRDVIMTVLGGDGIFINGGQVCLFDNVNVMGASSGAAFNIVSAGNFLFSECSSLNNNFGMKLHGTSDNVMSVDVNLCYFDQSKAAGIDIAATSPFYVQRCSFNQCWISSGLALGVAFAASTGSIKGIKFVGCEISDNHSNGFQLPAGTTADDIAIIGCTIANNHGAAGISVDSTLTSTLRVSGCAIGNGYGGWAGAPQQYGVVGGSSNLVCIGNSFAGNTVVSVQVALASQSQVIRNNIGIDDVMVTVSAAASVQLPVNPIIEIFGTTTVLTLTGVWLGRIITLFKTDAGTLTVGGGGNIPLAHTLAQNGSLQLTYINGNWY